MKSSKFLLICFFAVLAILSILIADGTAYLKKHRPTSLPELPAEDPPIIVQIPEGGWNPRWCPSTKGGAHSFVNGVCRMCGEDQEEFERKFGPIRRPGHEEGNN